MSSIKPKKKIPKFNQSEYEWWNRILFERQELIIDLLKTGVVDAIKVFSHMILGNPEDDGVYKKSDAKFKPIDLEPMFEGYIESNLSGLIDTMIVFLRKPKKNKATIDDSKVQEIINKTLLNYIKNTNDNFHKDVKTNSFVIEFTNPSPLITRIITNEDFGEYYLQKIEKRNKNKKNVDTVQKRAGTRMPNEVANIVKSFLNGSASASSSSK